MAISNVKDISNIFMKLREASNKLTDFNSISSVVKNAFSKICEVRKRRNKSEKKIK